MLALIKLFVALIEERILERKIRAILLPFLFEKIERRRNISRAVGANLKQNFIVYSCGAARSSSR